MEYESDFRQGHNEISIVKEHALSIGEYKFRFKDTQLVVHSSDFHNRLIHDVIKINRQTTTGRKERMKIDKIWTPAIPENNGNNKRAI